MARFRFKTDITEHCYIKAGDGSRIPLLDDDGIPTFEPQRTNKLAKLERAAARKERTQLQKPAPAAAASDKGQGNEPKRNEFII